MSELSDLVRELNAARYEAAVAKLGYESALNQWKIDHVGLFNDMIASKVRLDRLDTKLRETALAEYEATGNKTPTPGVSIKLMTEAKRNRRHHRSS
jgi:hypothetical protein